MTLPIVHPIRFGPYKVTCEGDQKLLKLVKSYKAKSPLTSNVALSLERSIEFEWYDITWVNSFVNHYLKKKSIKRIMVSSILTHPPRQNAPANQPIGHANHTLITSFLSKTVPIPTSTVWFDPTPRLSTCTHAPMSKGVTRSKNHLSTLGATPNQILQHGNLLATVLAACVLSQFLMIAYSSVSPTREVVFRLSEIMASCEHLDGECSVLSASRINRRLRLPSVVRQILPVMIVMAQEPNQNSTNKFIHKKNKLDGVDNRMRQLR